MVHIYTIEYYSAIKKNEIMSLAATWMDLEIIILSEVSQKNTIWYHLHVESKIWPKWTYPWNRNIQTQRTDLWLPRGREGGRVMDWEFEVSRCKLLHLEWINNKVLLYSTGNYIQSPGINHNGKEYKKKNVYMCITESLCCTTEISTTL